MRELGLIEHLRRRADGLPKAPGVTLGIGDDAAILLPRPGHEVVVTTDFSLEGRHFRRDWHAPEAVGHRILARGLSDLAAMGAAPLAAFLSLAVPRPLAAETDWMERVFDGLFALAEATGTPLAGGDTSEAPDDHLLADIVLLGQLPRGTALRRDAARPGDRLFVTGRLGGSAAELDLIADPTFRELMPPLDRLEEHPHLFPAPRLAVGTLLREQGLAHACMDLSDGLSSDLHKLCEAAGVRAVVDAACLPLHPLVLPHGEEALRLALHGGEDYELLFTAPPEADVPEEIAGVPVTEIGSILAPAPGKPAVTLIELDGEQKPLKPGGWEHLK